MPFRISSSLSKRLSKCCKVRDTLSLPILKHELYPNEQHRTRKSKKTNPFSNTVSTSLERDDHGLHTFNCPKELRNKELDSIRANHETHKICSHHHQDIEHASNGTDMTVPWFSPILEVAKINA
jgi:hypothetical protein